MIAYVDPDRCTGCGTCVLDCPCDVLRLDAARRRAVIAYRSDCQTCYVCELDCPGGAIRVDPQSAPGPVLVVGGTGEGR